MEQLAKKLMNWASILEDGTREQALRTASLPFIHPWVALMPDAHLGKGATVGSVIPTLGAIIPAAVGVDIGCGMIAVRSQFTAQDVRTRGHLAALRESIESSIPLSAGQYNLAARDAGTERRITDLEGRAGADSAEATSPNWRLQLGSLGSGNHFIEVSLDEEDRVWLFLHSGSRGVGNRLALRHIKIAQDLARRWWIPLPDPDLAYLVEGTSEFSAYLQDLHWAQHFALLNREEMMDRAVACLGTWIGEPVTPAETVNCHHNYTAREKHFGKEVWVSRKGAIDASRGHAGAHPGFHGDALVRGDREGQPGRAELVPARRRPPRAAARPPGRRSAGLSSTRPCRASSGAGPARSSTRSPVRTRTLTRSWKTRRTWSRSGTSCARSSTSRATEPRRAGAPPAHAHQQHLPPLDTPLSHKLPFVIMTWVSLERHQSHDHQPPELRPNTTKEAGVRRAPERGSRGPAGLGRGRGTRQQPMNQVSWPPPRASRPR